MADSIDTFNKQQKQYNQDRGLGMRQGKSAGGSGRTTANTGGSMAITKNKSGFGKGNSDVRDLGKAADGPIESPRKKMGKSKS